MGWNLIDAIAGKLTKPNTALELPSGERVVYDSPEQTRAVANQTLDALPEPGMQVVNGAPVVVAPDASKLPKIVQPSFQEATTDFAGNVKPSKALTKGGVLLNILKGGLQGGLDAIAGGALDQPRQGESTFGKGLAAAEEMPLVRAQRQTQTAMLPWLMRNKQLEVQKTQSEIDKNNAQADKAGYIPIPGVGLGQVQSDGSVAISVAKPTTPGVDKQIDAYVNGDGKRVLVMQKPNGQTYESVFGDVNQKDAAQNRDDQWIAIRQRELKAANPALSNDQSYKQAYDEWVNLTKTQPSLIRAEGFGETRGPVVKDTQTGVTAPMSWNDYNRLSQQFPGRYVSPQYDPETAEQMGEARVAGKELPTQIKSFRAFVGHAKDLSDAVNSFRTTSVPLINKPINWLRNNAGGSPEITKLMAKIEPVRKEFESFLLNNRALYSEDRVEGMKILDENKSPAQLQEAIKSFMHTAAIRLDTVNKQYHDIYGKDHPTMLDPQTKQILKEFNVLDLVHMDQQQPSAPAGGTGKPTGSKGGKPSIKSFYR